MSRGGEKSCRKIKKRTIAEEGREGVTHMWPADTFCHHKHV